MKTFKIITWIFAVTLVFFAPKAFAGKIIPFPDTKAIQPVPTTDSANVSGNIDWPRTGEDTTPETTNRAGSQSSTGQSETNNANNTSGAGNNPSNGAVDTNMPQVSGSGLNIGNQTGGNPSSVYSGSNPDGVNSASGQTNDQRNSNPSDSASFYNFNGTPQPNAQIQNASNSPIENNADINNNSAVNQNSEQQPKDISQSTYAWAITFGSLILLATAFVLWRLKRLRTTPTNSKLFHIAQNRVGR